MNTTNTTILRQSIALFLGWLLHDNNFVVESWSLSSSSSRPSPSSVEVRPSRTHVLNNNGSRPPQRRLLPRFSSSHTDDDSKIVSLRDLENDTAAAAADDDDNDVLQVEDLTTHQLLELIELSFFQACYALSKGEVEPLKLFIVVVEVAAHRTSPQKTTMTTTGAFAAQEVIALLHTVPQASSAARPLTLEEGKLRETWIQAIFLMMHHVLEKEEVGTTGEDSVEPDETAVHTVVTTTYGPILSDLVALHQSGMGLNVHQFVATRHDLLFPQKPPLTNNMFALEPTEKEAKIDPMQLAIVTQTINVLYTTLEVLADEEAEDNNVKGKNTNDDLTTEENKVNRRNDSSGGQGFG